jgi:arylsulfatase A-like enzyme
MHKTRFAPWRRGFNHSVGYLQGCESAWTHVASCCQARSPTSDQRYICPAPKEGKDYRGFDWFVNGAADPSAEGVNSAELVRAAATKFYLDRNVSASGDDADAYAPPPRPTFVYLAFQNVHAPYTCEARYRALYAGTADLTEDEKTMFGYISELDSVVGDVIGAMKSSGRYQSGLVIFSSDNGAPPAKGVRYRNAPFRGFKAHIWEGGVRVAAFVHAPALLPAAVRGTRSGELYHITDWLPTLLGRAGGAGLVPSQLSGFDVWPSLAHQQPSPRTELLYNINPLCDAGQAGAPKAGLRLGRWKLLAYCYEIEGIGGGRKTGPTIPIGGIPHSAGWPAGNRSVALFDLDADPTESVDVALDHPAQVRASLARLAQHASRSVEPMQWTPPYQGPNYECASCPLRPAVASPLEPWTPWL